MCDMIDSYVTFLMMTGKARRRTYASSARTYDSSAPVFCHLPLCTCRQCSCSVVAVWLPCGCGVLQRAAACCKQKEGPMTAPHQSFAALPSIHVARVLQCVAMCCSGLQYVAVCCSLLQCVTVRGSRVLHV